MTDLAKPKDHLLEDPDTHEEYKAQAPEFTVAHELIAARTPGGVEPGRDCRADGHLPVHCRTTGEPADPAQHAQP